MKKVFFCHIIIVLLLSVAESRAKASAPEKLTKTFRQTSLISCSPLHQVPVEIEKPAQCSFHPSKIRDQRLLPGLAGSEWISRNSRRQNFFTAISSDAHHLPLTRLLLFPKHNFW